MPDPEPDPEPGSGGVWLITGVQASGKSTIAELLARRYARGVHVRGGQFYRWAVRGWVHAHVGDDEARRHLALRYRLAARVADEYAAEGFTVVVQDNVYGDDVTGLLGAVVARPRRLVVLAPSRDAVAARDEARRRTTGKVAYRPGQYTIDGLMAALAETPRVGLRLDTSRETPEQTVAEIVARELEAVVDGAV